MDKQIFIINGSGGVGKDAFVSFVSEFTPTMNYSSVNKVKEIAKIIGWDGGKTEKDRKFLSDLKLLCTDYNNMPFNAMAEKVKCFLKSDNRFLFLHIRECPEIERAKKAFNAKTLLIKRDSVPQITSNMADANVFNYNYDIVIENNGTLKELQAKALSFVCEFQDDYLDNMIINNK